MPDRGLAGFLPLRSPTRGLRQASTKSAPLMVRRPNELVEHPKRWVSLLPSRRRSRRNIRRSALLARGVRGRTVGTVTVDLGRVPGHGRRGRSDAGATGCALRTQRALPEPGPPAQPATPTVGRRGLPARRRRLLAGATLSGDEVSVPAEACLWCPLLGRVVDVHKPEALPVTPAPLEVVH